MNILKWDGSKSRSILSKYIQGRHQHRLHNVANHSYALIYTKFTSTHLLLLTFRLALPAPHNVQPLALRHGTHVRPAGIRDIANHRPAHLAVGVGEELADETLVRAEAEGRAGRVGDVDAVALDALGPGAAARPVRAGAVVGAEELDLDALRGGEGEEGEGEEGDEGVEEGCGVHFSL